MYPKPCKKTLDVSTAMSLLFSFQATLPFNQNVATLSVRFLRTHPSASAAELKLDTSVRELPLSVSNLNLAARGG